MSLRVRRAVLAIVVAAFTAAACNTRLLGKKYEYEEDLYLSLDGSADLIVNASIPALVALRGLDLNAATSRVDRAAVRAAFDSSPIATVIRVSRPWTRGRRRFVQVRLRVSDVRKLSQTRPFAWSRYELGPENAQHLYRQTVGASALRPGTLQNVGWDGSELVAFRLHLPSHIRYHNARSLDTNEPRSVERGNILTWEQHLTDRLDGQPLMLEVRMDSESILYRTLWLFAGAFLAAVLLIGFLIWLTIRKGAKETITTP
jgi:hypothetical protein